MSMPPKDSSSATSNVVVTKPYQQTAKAALEAAKTYSTQLRQSSTNYAKEMAQPAQRVVKESLQSATDKATRLTQEQVTQPARQAFQKSAQQVQSASSRLAASATKVAQDQVAQRAAQQAAASAQEIAKQTSQTFWQELRSTKRDALRWLWWWSLAAVAVYGVATTLPGELLREYSRSRKQQQQQAIEAQPEESKLSAWFCSGGSEDNAQAEDPSKWNNAFGWSTNQQDEGGWTRYWPLSALGKKEEAKETSTWNWPKWS